MKTNNLKTGRRDFLKKSTNVVAVISVLSTGLVSTGAVAAPDRKGKAITGIPTQALTVGPKETWKAEKVSIWQAGTHDNPFGQRLTAFMISKGIMDSSVPMSLLADHPNVQFNYYRGALGHVQLKCTNPDHFISIQLPIP